ncbi:MAG: Ig-like domain-containing protein, partial [Dehalococcoidia bacterium]
STRATKYGSREGANPPQLIIQANATPIADGKAVVTNVDAAVTITLTASDANGDCPLTFTIVDQPLDGTLGAITSVQCSGGAASAQVTYTPNPGVSGSDSFSYTATDPFGADSSPAAVTITVGGSP